MGVSFSNTHVSYYATHKCTPIRNNRKSEEFTNTNQQKETQSVKGRINIWKAMGFKGVFWRFFCDLNSCFTMHWVRMRGGGQVGWNRMTAAGLNHNHSWSLQWARPSSLSHTDSFTFCSIVLNSYFDFRFKISEKLC